MSDRSSIEWTNATWNPVRGCTRVSPGCDRCYAVTMAHRFNQPGFWGEGLTRIRNKDGAIDWSGNITVDESKFRLPRKWKQPRRIFVCSTSDLFHHAIDRSVVDRIFDVMRGCERHTFQLLTKRPERAREYLSKRHST